MNMSDEMLEKIIEMNDDLYYWAYSWAKTNHKPISEFIKTNKEEIFSLIGKTEDEMKFFATNTNGHCYDSLNDLIMGEFDVKSPSEVKKVYSFTKDDQNLILKYGNVEKTVYAFKGGSGYQDIIELI